MYSVVVFVPVSHVDEVKNAVFEAGGGRIGDYDNGCWQSLGDAQFRPLPGSAPFLGEPGKLQKVAEWRVEFVAADECVREVVEAIKRSHPYEQPAYHVVEIMQF